MRLFCSLLVGGCWLAAAVGCKRDEIVVPRTGLDPFDTTIHAVAVTPHALTIAIGGAAPLTASIDAGPAAPDRRLRWVAKNPFIATVDTAGVVHAINVGTTIVRAVAFRDSMMSDSATITVGTIVLAGR